MQAPMMTDSRRIHSEYTQFLTHKYISQIITTMSHWLHQ